MYKSLFIRNQSNGIPSMENYNLKYNLNWTSNDTEISKQQLFNDATYSLEEIVKRIKVRTIFDDIHGTHTFEVDLNKIQDTITEQRHRAFGRCYTYHPEERMRKLGIYFINAEL